MAVRRSRFVLLALVAFLFFVSCAAPPAPPRSPAGNHRAASADSPLYVPAPEAKVYAFTCADGYSFTASVQQTSARLFTPDRSVFLPHRPSLSGGRYSAGGTTLFLAGGSARLEQDGRIHGSCRNDRRRAVWERARLSGVDFRAVGNEPGWLLEIYEGEKIVLVRDYGRHRSVFPFTKPEIGDAGARRRYLTDAGGRVLDVLVQRQPCADTMSGERFDSAVTVSFNGRMLSGCGRNLRRAADGGKEAD